MRSFLDLGWYKGNVVNKSRGLSIWVTRVVIKGHFIALSLVSWLDHCTLLELVKQQSKWA